MIAQTLQLALSIAIVWAAGMLLAVGIRAILPDKLGIKLIGKESTLFVPFIHMGFWTCLLAAFIVTALVVVREMLADMGWSNFR